jgi:hypothetical protein
MLQVVSRPSWLLTGLITQCKISQLLDLLYADL